MKRKKILALLLAGAMTAGLLAGCGGDNSQTSQHSTDDVPGA